MCTRGTDVNFNLILLSHKANKWSKTTTRTAEGDAKCKKNKTKKTKTTINHFSPQEATRAEMWVCISFCYEDCKLKGFKILLQL